MHKCKRTEQEESRIHLHSRKGDRERSCNTNKDGSSGTGHREPGRTQSIISSIAEAKEALHVKYLHGFGICIRRIRAEETGEVDRERLEERKRKACRKHGRVERIGGFTRQTHISILYRNETLILFMDADRD